MRTLATALIGLLIITTSAYAVPYLQLDVEAPDRFYNEETSPGSEVGVDPDINVDTIATYSRTFTLRALIDQGSNFHDSNYTFVLVAALTPKTANRGALDLGTFEFNSAPYQIIDSNGDPTGLTDQISTDLVTANPVDSDPFHTVHVTDDMTYGIPPTDPNQTSPTHGVYETYYAEFQFTPVWTNQMESYNVEPDPAPEDLPAPGDMLTYAEFNIDVNNIADGYGIHFDFYAFNSDGKKLYFAPFSHDAEVGAVPEPATLMLMGFGLIGLASLGRKKKA